VVQLLLTNGADPNVPEEDDEYPYRQTFPLHIAAADCNVELVELLLKHGANIDVTDSDGNTALHHAIKHYDPTTLLQYSDEVVASSTVKSVVDVLLENKADVNTVNRSGKTPLYKAASAGLLDVVSKMLQIYGGNPNGRRDKRPLTAACSLSSVEIVDLLLKHGADPNLESSRCDKHKSKRRLFVSFERGNSYIVKSAAIVKAMNHEGNRSVLHFAVEKLTSCRYYQSTEEMKKTVSIIRLLLQHGADFNILMTDRHSPLYLLVTALSEAYQTHRMCYRTDVVKLLQHGAMLLESSQLGDDRHSCRQSLNSGTLKALATFDGKHEFIVDLFRAGAGFQLTAFCCNAVATCRWEAKSIRLCQAVVLAGYSPSAEELGPPKLLQWIALIQKPADTVLKHKLVNWLNEDRQQAPSLFRQCRVAIRRLLSVAAHYQTILPAIDKLLLPNNVKLYLQFDGPLSEVDLSVSMELQTSETDEEISVEDRLQ